jgi:hypothetical protein
MLVVTRPVDHGRGFILPVTEADITLDGEVGDRVPAIAQAAIAGDVVTGLDVTPISSTTVVVRYFLSVVVLACAG